MSDKITHVHSIAHPLNNVTIQCISNSNQGGWECLCSKIGPFQNGEKGIYNDLFQLKVQFAVYVYNLGNSLPDSCARFLC